MRRILAGIETEYGLLVEGRGAEDQIDDAKALVRSYPGECLAIWDYRHESPRADLRGFHLERLAVDPVDIQFDRNKHHGPSEDIRSDRILPNGARFYNDHGHPEYATPETWSLGEIAHHDRFGELVVRAAAKAYAESNGQEVRLYKNNTDFHGASYGTHENFLVPRSLGFERLYQAVLPMLVVRPILCGAGKVGSESGDWADFQLSQRVDFFMEAVNAETLYRRPVFNTRDECHADPADWMRLHVIAGDANMMPSNTMRKISLVKLAILLAEADAAPIWKLRNPVSAAQSVSRDMEFQYRVELEGRNWTTGYEVLESYFASAEQVIGLDDELRNLIQESRKLLAHIQSGNWQGTRGKIDWAAKRNLLEQYMAENGGTWKDESMRAFDLEYHNIDPDEGLYHALVEMGEVEMPLREDEVAHYGLPGREGTRALARGLAISKFAEYIHTACWRSITFKIDGRLVEVPLRPDMIYPSHLEEIDDVVAFISVIKGEL